MRKFLDMVECARTRGVHASYDDGPGPMRDYTHTVWFEAVEQCQPFVFNFPDSYEFDDASISFNDANFAPIPDAPFEVFSIEFLNRPIIALKPNGLKGDDYIFVHCILCVETAPAEFTFFGLLSYSIDSGLHAQAMVVKLKERSRLVSGILEHLKKSKVGAERVRERVKIGNGQNKRTHTIRRIIHVSPKSKIASEVYESRQIDWTHRFLVRGHWRKIERGLGKNRAGDYCVEGFTWVTEHERGPDDAPLVTKTRIVL